MYAVNMESRRGPKCHIASKEVSIFVYFPCFQREVNRNGELVSAALILPFGGAKIISNGHNGSLTTSNWPNSGMVAKTTLITLGMAKTLQWLEGVVEPPHDFGPWKWFGHSHLAKWYGLTTPDAYFL